MFRISKNPMSLIFSSFLTYWGGSLASWVDFLGLTHRPYVPVQDVIDPIHEDAFLNEIPQAFANLSISFIKDNLAVIPGEWDAGDIKIPCYDIQSDQVALLSTLSKIKSTDFTVWDSLFFDMIGPQGRFERIQSFEGESHVHEAPAFVPETNELFYADTSVIGWLWAINVDTHKARKVKTNPPLANVNGARYHNGHVYVTTNGGSTRAIFAIDPLDGSATPVVNNFRGRHFNSPNDLVFDGNSNMWFSDPCYGWYQGFPSVQPPELPNTIYFLDMKSKALVAASNSIVTAPNGLAFSPDGSTLYVADSNSTAGRPLEHYSASVRNVWAFDVSGSILSNPRLVYFTESGWPDGLQVTRNGFLMIASLGGVDVVDPNSGKLLGRINTPSDTIFNLERGPQLGDRRMWLLTGRDFIYKVLIKAS